jgi:hypothetical protein
MRTDAFGRWRGSLRDKRMNTRADRFGAGLSGVDHGAGVGGRHARACEDGGGICKRGFGSGREKKGYGAKIRSPSNGRRARACIGFSVGCTCSISANGGVLAGTNLVDGPTRLKAARAKGRI